MHLHGESSKISSELNALLLYSWVRNYLRTIHRHFGVIFPIRFLIQILLGIFSRKPYYLWGTLATFKSCRLLHKDRGTLDLAKIPGDLLLKWYDLRNYVFFWVLKYLLWRGSGEWDKAVTYGTTLVGLRYLLMRIKAVLRRNLRKHR